MSVLVVGSVAFDAVKTSYGQRDRLLAGAATYFALAASYFTHVGVVAVVGDDFGEEEMRVFRERGISTVGIEHAPGKSFFWSGEYNADFSKRLTLDTQLNVFATFQPQIPDIYKDYRYLMLGNIDPELQSLVQSQMPTAGLVACDTMNYWIEGRLPQLKETLRRVDVLLINDEEVRQLTGEHNLLRAARAIHQMGPKMLVIKHGEHGASLYRDGRVFTAPAFPLEEVVDPTGAGDSFAGGFMGSLASTELAGEYELRRAMIYGSVMGSFCVEQFGTERLQALNRGEINARYRLFRELMHFD
jgi:sugar/nucleoside kinase (ribokinase family)